MVDAAKSLKVFLFLFQKREPLDHDCLYIRDPARGGVMANHILLERPAHAAAAPYRTRPIKALRAPSDAEVIEAVEAILRGIPTLPRLGPSKRLSPVPEPRDDRAFLQAVQLRLGDDVSGLNPRRPVGR